MRNHSTKVRNRHGKQLLRSAAALLLCVCLFPLGSIQAQAKGPAQAIGVGIDVSRYQGNIDWSAVAASGVQFAFIKVGSIPYGIDPCFDRNMQLAAQNGVRTGVYLYSYARSLEEVVSEAVLVLQAIAPYTVNMPVVIDMEDSVQSGLSPAELAAIANTFCAVIEGAGYYPMIYANKYWFTKKIGPVGFDKWVAQYAAACDLEDAAFWQATNKMALPGIAGDVDLDYQYKDLSASIVSDGFVYRKGFFFFYENYKMKTNSFVQFNGGTYYVDPYGRRVSGFAQLGDAIFYFDGDGLMATGWQVLADQTYYFGTDGRMAMGLVEIGDQFYLFDANGCMYRGWLPAAGMYYFYEDGHMARGLSPIEKDIYYFDENGFLQTGWQKIAGQTYFFHPADAKMVKGLQQIGEDRYYFDPASGAMQTGILVVDGSTYLFGEDGRAAVGLRQLGEEFFLFDAEGKLVVGQQIVAGDTLYVIDEAGRVTCVPVAALPQTGTEAK